MLKVVGVALLGLVAVVVVRTLMFTLVQGPLPPAAALPIDAQAAAERLAGAVRIPTVTRSEAPQLDPVAFETLHRYLRSQFPLAHTRLSTETVSRHSLLFRWEGTDPSLKPILLMAHQDVVPVEEGSRDEWVHPPFGGVIADGFVWGRGTIDDKQGVMGLLEAVELLLQSEFRPRRTVYLAFGHDEEIGGRQGAKQIADLLARRRVALAFVLDEGGVLTQGVVPDVEDWVALVGVAEKGIVSLALTATGQGGHSSMPPRQTAVGVLAKAIATLEAKPLPARTDTAKRFFARVAPKMPFLKRLVFANTWLFEPLLVNVLSQKGSTNALLRTTTAATIFRGGVKDNVLPRRAEAVVNFRIMPGETPASVKAYVEQTVGDERVTVAYYGADEEGFASAPSKTSSTESEAFQAVSDTIRQVAQDEGLVVAPYLVLSATDSRYFDDVADDVYRFGFNRFGPDDLRRLHGINERISVETYAESIAFYALLIKRTAGASSALHQ